MPGIRVNKRGIPVRKGIATAAVAATVCVLLFGCASEQSRKAEYKRAVTLPPLEVPPDLTAPELQGTMDMPQGNTASATQGGTVTGGGIQVLPQQANVRVLRDGNMHWLQVDAAPEQLWVKLRNFWQQQGLEVKRDEPRLGFMETQWAENKADVPGDWIQGVISNLFQNAYSAPTRDKFRLRVERGSTPNTSEIFITHYGLEEVLRSSNAESYDTMWQTRPSDPELAGEMLNRLMVFFGVLQATADTQLAADAPAARARLEEGNIALVVNEAFPRAWRRVGIALDRLGLVVEDRDRSAGIYYIRPVDQGEDGKAKKGFFSSMFSGKEEEAAQAAPARIQLQDGGETTRVTVQDAEGKLDVSAAAAKILQQLETELR
ncbi:MAG: hypothetical protein CVV05_11080 [Gammaproteobacteria bacterium HGW-Gammaproteobacteria-1]|jgi:outer membrane protein assembly factor BamC|nr:MAG: hypothetical protein CVV05_11080 [Gammaproteobacteria bacterium HGW-Gammaproteobacteria-1]